jgi:hypothetical protein
MRRNYKRRLLDELSAIRFQSPDDRPQTAGRGAQTAAEPGRSDLPEGVIRLDDSTYRALIGGRMVVFEKAQIVERLSGRWKRHLSRYLVGWTGGVLHELFLGVVEAAGEFLSAVEGLHRWLDALVPRLGLPLLGEAFKVMEFRAARG